MIEVIIRHKESETELGRIEIENVTGDDTELADYRIAFGVERIASVGVHRRIMLNFPRNRYNVLGLLTQALNTLQPEELELEGKVDLSKKAQSYPGGGVMGAILRGLDNQ